MSKRSFTTAADGFGDAGEDSETPLPHKRPRVADDVEKCAALPPITVSVVPSSWGLAIPSHAKALGTIETRAPLTIDELASILHARCAPPSGHYRLVEPTTGRTLSGHATLRSLTCQDAKGC